MHLGLLPLLIRQSQPFRVDVFNRINSADRTISEHFTDINLLILSFLDEIHELQIFVPRRCGSKHRIMFIRLLFICRSTSFLCHANRSRELYSSPKQHQNSTRKLAKNPAQSAPDNKLWTGISFQKWISRYKEHLLSHQTHPRVVNQRETSPLFAMNFNVFAFTSASCSIRVRMTLTCRLVYMKHLPPCRYPVGKTAQQTNSGSLWILFRTLSSEVLSRDLGWWMGLHKWVKWCFRLLEIRLNEKEKKVFSKLFFPSYGILLLTLVIIGFQKQTETWAPSWLS